jgi:uncharacterized protein YndB with AHSA1/START domain
MTDHSVTHGTFALEYLYPAPPARVFNAWADPAVKARWIAGAVDAAAAPMRMDFRVGGTEQTVSSTDDGTVIVYERLFRDIVPAERIVVANWIDVGGQRISISQFTAEFRSDGLGTRLVVTEQGAYLDGCDSPDSRAIGIRAQLDALALELENSTADTQGTA